MIYVNWPDNRSAREAGLGYGFNKDSLRMGLSAAKGAVINLNYSYLTPTPLSRSIIDQYYTYV